MDSTNASASRAVITSAALLGLSLIVAVGIGAASAYRIKTIGSTIAVTGSAEKIITSDTVKWTGRISRSVGVDGLQKGNTDMKADLAEARRVMTEAGVTDAQFTVRPIGVYAIYGQSDPSNPYSSTRITGYNLEQTFTVESGDVNGVTTLATTVADAMLAKGVVFATDSLEYYYSKFADLKLDLLSEATANAKARAQRIAESTGGKLGALNAASQGVFQVTGVNSLEISDYGTYDTSVIEKKVTAVARTEFLVR